MKVSHPNQLNRCSRDMWQSDWKKKNVKKDLQVGELPCNLHDSLMETWNVMPTTTAPNSRLFTPHVIANLILKMQ